ncbi:MAG: protein-L-isoaspartate(D-aspartate) O-methyltransferase [Cytophagales bacterium]
MVLVDNYKHKGLRFNLVETLKSKGISDLMVLRAVSRVPRHFFFFDKAFENHAYKDKAFPIGEGQTISQPYTVAFQTQSLNLKPEHKVLEIGTGSGYQCAILLEMGVEVVSIETIENLYIKTKNLLLGLGYRPILKLGDGSLGVPQHAPYDRIIVTAGAPNVPDSLLDQLKIGGKLIIPIGSKDTQKMILLTKISEFELHQEELGAFSFVPLLGTKGWNK